MDRSYLHPVLVKRVICTLQVMPGSEISSVAGNLAPGDPCLDWTPPTVALPTIWTDQIDWNSLYSEYPRPEMASLSLITCTCGALSASPLASSVVHIQVCCQL